MAPDVREDAVQKQSELAKKRLLPLTPVHVAVSGSACGCSLQLGVYWTAATGSGGFMGSHMVHRRVVKQVVQLQPH